MASRLVLFCRGDTGELIQTHRGCSRTRDVGKGSPGCSCQTNIFFFTKTHFSTKIKIYFFSPKSFDLPFGKEIYRGGWRLQNDKEVLMVSN